MPVWHVSLNDGTEAAKWRGKKRERMLRKAMELLTNVGGKRCVFHVDLPGAMSLHIQSPLTDVERELLPVGWLDIPAIDERGPMVVWSDVSDWDGS